MKLEKDAKKVARAGRHGDSVLVHMSPEEVMALASMGNMTVNPKTGLPEAFKLSSFFSAVAPIAGAFLGGPAGAALGGAIGAGISGKNPITGALTSWAGTQIPGLFSGTGPLANIFGNGAGATPGAVAGAGGISAGAPSFSTPSFASSVFDPNAWDDIGAAANLGGGGGSAWNTMGSSAGNVGGPLMEGLLPDPATGLPITPPMYEGGAPNFPGTPGHPINNITDLDRVIRGTQGEVPVEDRSHPNNPAAGNFPADIRNRIAGAIRLGGKLPAIGQSASGIPFGAMNMVKSAFDIGSGIYGMDREKKLRDMAMRAYDPVRELMANPGMVTGIPGYQFGMDQGRLAIQRRMAAQGGGGNEDIALARFTPEYAQNFYQNEIARRMNLGQGSGALNLSAGNSANSLASSSLGSIGYGLARMGGLPNQNDQIQRFLMKVMGIG